MQAQSRHAASSGGDEHDAMVRELERGRELTARLQEEALRALRGRGQSEKTAAFILQEVSRAFAVCLSIMNAPGRAPPPPPAAAAAPEMPEPGVPPRRSRDDSVPRTETVTYWPHADGYLWRKYGQKRITKTYFPRCYYRCSYHRERGCPAIKQVQQRSHGDPPEYVVVYLNEHTCNNTPASSEPEVAAAAPAAADYALDLPGLTMLRRRQHGVPGAAMDERDAKLEQERRALVSSLACVLGGGGAVAQEAMHRGRTGDASASASASASAALAAASPVVGASDELPGLDVDGGGLDVMDYDVAGELCFGDTYGLHDDGSTF
ncbi:hypothetical protein ACP4OV_019798 [Aristida adscensionis]